LVTTTDKLTKSQITPSVQFVGFCRSLFVILILILIFMCQANGEEKNGDYKLESTVPRKLMSASSTCSISTGKYITVLKHVNKCYGSCASLKQSLTKAEKTGKAAGKTTADANYLNIILQTTNFLKEYTYVLSLCENAAFNSAACIGCAEDGKIFASQYAGYKRLYAECTSKLHGDCSEVCPYLKQVVNYIPNVVASIRGIALGCGAN
jgi:hypothetical protein